MMNRAALAFDRETAARWSAPGERPHIMLDLTRLLSRLLHPTATGVDRVEMAYARGLLEVAPERLDFVARHPSRAFGLLDRDAVLRFLDTTTTRWTDEGDGERRTARAMRAASATLSLWPRPLTRRAGVLLKVSPTGSDEAARLQRLKRRGMRLVCLVHDLIPLQFPEYARPGGSDEQARRVTNLLDLADALIANSQATRDAIFHAAAGARIACPPVTTVPLGHEVPGLAEPGDVVRPLDSGRPYFVCLGTIEPRKNHLLLLNIWRRMAETLPPAAVPRLFIVGRRGWENENVLDMLDRCLALQPHVTEMGRIPDRSLASLLRGARALLMPSFAEGFGMPVAEALASGVPVIASDIPAHREAGSAVPAFIDPLDGPAWLAEILDYAAPLSARRAAQLRRMTSAPPLPTWRRHISAALKVIDGVGQC